jgi:hypothetical protein
MCPQEIRAWLELALSVVTLVVLAIYGWDTHRIAVTITELGENSQKPFITIAGLNDNESTLENQGVGVALNVQGWVYNLDGTRHEFIRENIGAGRHSQKPIPINRTTLRNARFEYASLGGNEYVTEIDQTGFAKFIKCPPVKKKNKVMALFVQGL